MKNNLKTYIPWALFIVIPAVFCTVLYAVQLYNANVFFGIQWNHGFITVVYEISNDLVQLCRPLAAFCLCILAVMRPFAEKRDEFVTGMRWITAALLAVFALSFVVYSGIHGLAFNTVWDWLADILRVAVIPVVVAVALVRQKKLSAPVRWAITAVVCVVMVASSVNTLILNELYFQLSAPYIIGTLAVTYCELCPALFSLAPSKK